jgi:vancomycin permeability regulator SanA
VRYVIAMLCGLAATLAAAVFASGPIASAVVRQFEFDSPDTVAALHTAVFMGANLLALVLGWLIGWGLGRPRGPAKA